MRIIVTDLDRTLIPNGNSSLTNGAMQLFKREVKKNHVKLIFITGRNKRLLKDGIRRYNLPAPEFCIGDIGTSFFEYKKGKLHQKHEWRIKFFKEWKDYRRNDIAKLLSSIKELRQQESTKLNEFKQSYYLSLDADRKKILKQIHSKLRKKNISAAIIYSVDVVRKIGLLDIVPKSGTKLSALDRVRKKFSAKKNEMMYCGDSENDISSLLYGCYAVLVKNASEDVKRKLLIAAKRKNILERIHIAKGFKNLNGNYVSGIIEGAYRFNFFR